MFSALKRWTKMGSEDSKLSMPSGVKAMGQALQRKFARGVQYNMKIVIKGDRNTGKTCMLHRLQGRQFNEQYIPTSEIQAGSIHWNYRATDDIVKVDVWDVVDVGKSRKPSDSLKMDHNSEIDDNVVADAYFLDVYKGTHGVIMLMDITKPWTFQYLRRELPKVPAHIPVLVLGNHRDMDEHRLVDQEEVIGFIQNLERPDRSPPIHYAESSMKNGFGLKYIHTFLNFPFLLVQRESLLQQLQVNAMDMESTLEELQIYKQTEEQDYDKYLDFLDNKSKEREIKLAAEAEAAEAAITAAKTSGDVSSSADGSPSMSVTGKETRSTSSSVTSPDNQPRGGILSKWFSSSKTSIENEEVIPKQQSASQASPTNIEEFRPGDEIDAGFLEEESSGREKKLNRKQPKPTKTVEKAGTPSESSDESDSDPVNPMVAGFVEDISDDETVSRATPSVANSNGLDPDDVGKREVKSRPVLTEVHITSSEEEEEETEVLKPSFIVQPEPQIMTSSKPPDGLKIALKSGLNTNHGQRERTYGKPRSASNDIDDWLDSPDLDSKLSLDSKSEMEYSVRKIDIDNHLESTPETAVTVDEWSLFMSQQMSSTENKSLKTTNENKHHKKKEHKSGEKSHKKHTKHKEKDEEMEGEKVEGEKERRKSKERENDKDNEKKKKKKHKHSKKKSSDAANHTANQEVNYEEL